MSKTIKGTGAQESGLVDAVTSANELVNAACSWALEIVEKKKPWFRSLHRTDNLPDLAEVKDVMKFARVQAKMKAANVQHPIVCIDVIEEGIVSGPRAGLMKVNHQLVLFYVSIAPVLLSIFSFSNRKPSLGKCLSSLKQAKA